MNFTLKNSKGKDVSLKNIKEKFTVVYFYPQDNTPGCTVEAGDFTKLVSEFQKLNTKIIGISPDSTESHCQFIDDHNLTIELLSDPDKKVIKEFGAWGKKNLYGKEYVGLIRSTFILDKNKEIIHSFKNVRAKGHAQRVLDKIKELQ